jgi:hypothetical protein
VPLTAPDRSGASIFLSTVELKALNAHLNDMRIIDRFFGNDDTITPAWRLNLHILVTDALLKLDEG